MCQSPRRWPSISIHVLSRIFWLWPSPQKRTGQLNRTTGGARRTFTKKVKQSTNLQISLKQKKRSAFATCFKDFNGWCYKSSCVFSKQNKTRRLGIVVRGLGKSVIQLRMNGQPEVLPSPYPKVPESKNFPKKNSKFEHITKFPAVRFKKKTHIIILFTNCQCVL